MIDCFWKTNSSKFLINYSDDKNMRGGENRSKVWWVRSGEVEGLRSQTKAFHIINRIINVNEVKEGRCWLFSSLDYRITGGYAQPLCIALIYQSLHGKVDKIWVLVLGTNAGSFEAAIAPAFSCAHFHHGCRHTLPLLHRHYEGERSARKVYW